VQGRYYYLDVDFVQSKFQEQFDDPDFEFDIIYQEGHAPQEPDKMNAPNLDALM